MSKQTSLGNWVVAVIVVLGVVAAGVYLARKAMHEGEPPPVAAPASSSSVASGTTAPSIQHPISQASAPASTSTAPLPALDDSDSTVAAALATLAGGGNLRGLLLPQQIIARIVATIDALPRHGLSAYVLPLHTPKGSFITANADGSMVIGAQNAMRYAPYMQLVESADPKMLVAWYVHAYPLFQEAYRQLGYPKGYFNDRLITVIDNLLAVPDLTQPPSLVQSKSFYVYTDPSLESLSAGEKLLIRVGPRNEAKIKAKLRAIRSELTGQTFPVAPTSAGAVE